MSAPLSRKVRCAMFYWATVVWDLLLQPSLPDTGLREEVANLWTSEESPSSPQPHPLPPRYRSPCHFGHCSAVKETHGVVRCHLVLQEQPHNEDPQPILIAQKRTLLTLRTSFLLPHSFTKRAGKQSLRSGSPGPPRTGGSQGPYNRTGSLLGCQTSWQRVQRKQARVDPCLGNQLSGWKRWHSC